MNKKSVALGVFLLLFAVVSCVITGASYECIGGLVLGAILVWIGAFLGEYLED